MRFATSAVLALPLLAAAQVESPLDQIMGQVKAWGSYLQTFIPSPDAPSTPAAVPAKVGSKIVHALTLNDWEETVKSKIQPGATADSYPEQWWILLTGGNKTCFGHCGQAEKAFNETAALWSVDALAPHLGYINCDSQPVLCNSWAAGPPTLWILNVKPSPAKNDLWITGLSVNTTSQDIIDIRTKETYKEGEKYEGYFHPLDGPIHQFGLSKAVGYFFWVFTVVPSWLFMIIISFASRSFMYV